MWNTASHIAYNTEGFLATRFRKESMSVLSANILHEPRFGLSREDIEKIAKIERLEDVTERFKDKITVICKAFGSLSDMMIFAFDENSGGQPETKALFKAFIQCERNVMYFADMSNKECCVVFVLKSVAMQELESKQGVLDHEYAHHFQFAHGGFPYYICKQKPSMQTPSFATPYEVGPAEGIVSIDDMQLPDLSGVIGDSNERISDMICEGLLRERKLSVGLAERYRIEVTRPEDPAPYLPSPSLQRYIRRLMLRDLAELGACVRLANTNLDTSLLSNARKKARNLNKKYINAHKIYDAIFELCLGTDFNLFRSPERAVAYTKRIFELLDIEVKTSEKW